MKTKDRNEKVLLEFLDKDVTTFYYPSLQRLELVDSVNCCLVMAKLETLFEKHPEGFEAYSDYWVDELGISVGQLRTAFGKIGMQYKSLSQMKASVDLFQGKYYASFQNRSQNNVTRYLRNHDLVERGLQMLKKQIGGMRNKE